MASNLVENRLSRIVADAEQNHLKKHPWSKEIAKTVSGGFYTAIEKRKEEDRNGKS